MMPEVAKLNSIELWSPTSKREKGDRGDRSDVMVGWAHYRRFPPRKFSRRIFTPVDEVLVDHDVSKSVGIVKKSVHTRARTPQYSDKSMLELITVEDIVDLYVLVRIPLH
jgi:hypothetical protein